MAYDPLYRAYLLAHACRDNEAMEIEGVHFDLRHPDLDRNAWQPTALIGSPHHLETHTPRLLFPWSDDIERRIQDNRGDTAEVLEGDTLLIDRVQSLPVKANHGSLDHPHHQESRWAHLVVRRPSGRQRAVGQAWEFRGVADVMTPLARGNYLFARRALYARLCTAIGIEDIEDITLADSPKDWPKIATDIDPLYRKALDALWAAEGEHVEEAAAVFGYLMGRAEAREHVLPLAARHAEILDSNRRNARKSRKGGEETRRIALLVIAETPDINRRKCAEKVAALRGLVDIRSIERGIAPYFQKVERGGYRPHPGAVAQAKAAASEGG